MLGIGLYLTRPLRPSGVVTPVYERLRLQSTPGVYLNARAQIAPATYNDIILARRV